MNAPAPVASAIEESNALALAIIPSGINMSIIFLLCHLSLLFDHQLHDMFPSHDTSIYILIGAGASSSGPSPLQAKDLDPTGWELALVSTPGNNISSVQDRQLVGNILH